MASQEEWRRIQYEKWVGEQGNNSIGSTPNSEGYKTFLANQRRAAELSTWPVYTPPPAYPINSSTPSLPNQSTPYVLPDESFRPYRSSERGWIDGPAEFIAKLWIGLKISAFALAVIVSLSVWYKIIGPKPFIFIGSYLALGVLVCLGIWIAYRAAKWFFDTKVGQFVAWVIYITVSAGVALFIAYAAWVMSKTL